MRWQRPPAVIRDGSMCNIIPKCRSKKGVVLNLLVVYNTDKVGFLVV